MFVFTAQVSLAQVKTIKGLVSDQNGLPLPGVSIIVQGTKTATQSDYDGKYTIEASTGDILVFSYIGIKTKDCHCSRFIYNKCGADRRCTKLK